MVRHTRSKYPVVSTQHSTLPSLQILMGHCIAYSWGQQAGARITHGGVISGLSCTPSSRLHDLFANTISIRGRLRVPLFRRFRTLGRPTTPLSGFNLGCLSVPYIISTCGSHITPNYQRIASYIGTPCLARCHDTRVGRSTTISQAGF
jgi:hypothetical protein